MISRRVGAAGERERDSGRHGTRGNEEIVIDVFDTGDSGSRHVGVVDRVGAPSPGETMDRRAS